MALEQISFMVGSKYNPQETFQNNVKQREVAYTKLMGILKGGKRKKLKKYYELIKYFGPTRNTPKYTIVLYVASLRKKVLKIAETFVKDGRIDDVDEIFYLKLEELCEAIENVNMDIRRIMIPRKLFRDRVLLYFFYKKICVHYVLYLLISDYLHHLKFITYFTYYNHQIILVLMNWRNIIILLYDFYY